MPSSVRRSCLVAAAATFLSAAVGFAQDAVTSSTVSVVPHVIKYSGSLPDAPAAASVLEVRFAMYAAPTGGEALWQETQQVALDPAGRYSALLGATLAGGLPRNLFANGEPRWLGLTVAGQESPRTLLAASAYALKASDAETLGGHPATDFALKNAKPESGTDITQINAGTGITVSGNGTATVTVGLNTAYLASLTTNFAVTNAANTFTGNQIVKGNLGVSGTLTTATGANKLAPGGAVDISYANGIYTIGLDGTQAEAFGNGLWAQLAAANTFKGTQALAATSSATATNGFNSNALKFSASAFNSTVSAAEAINYFWQAEPSGNNTTAPAGTLDLLYSTGANAGAETGLKISNLGRITFASGQTFPGVPSESGSNTFTGNQTVDGTDTINGTAAGNISGTLGQLTVTDTGTSTTNAVAVSANSGYIAVSANGSNTNGVGVSAAGVFGVRGSAPGTDSSVTGVGTGVGVGGGGGVGVWGQTNYSGNDVPAIGVEGSIPNGLTLASGVGYGVYGADLTANGYIAVAGNSTNGAGVYGITGSYGNFGVHGVQVSRSSVGIDLANVGGAGLWGDTSVNADNGFGGVLGSADDNSAGSFFNNSGTGGTNSPTIYASNGGNGGTGTSVPVITAVGNTGACGINGAGDVTCSGRLKTAVPAAAGTRQVEVYSMQSPENWFEDFGSARLENGHATVTIDPQFGELVNTGVDYRVFLTPRGDCKGLYVGATSAREFEVHELAGGTTNVAFDYRIVAKRNGHEKERLADATVEMRGMTARRSAIARKQAMQSAPR